MTTPERDELTLGQLHAQLHELLATREDAGSWPVRIPYSRGRPALGNRTATAVRAKVGVGFDHDARRVFLEPVTALGLGDDELKTLGLRAEKQAGLIYLLRREAEKAKAAAKDTELAGRILHMIANLPGGMPEHAAKGSKR